MPKGLQGFQKGHKLFLLKHSDEMKKKMSEIKTKKKIQLLCCLCGIEFNVHPCRTKSKFCSRKCFGLSKKNKAPWNKGLKGFMAGKNHHWFGRDMSGENSPVYIKDRTKLVQKQERNDPAYKEWRRQVWLRDNFMCKIANPDCDGRIEAHHILGWTRYPELRYEVNNGITLCHFHHPRKREDEVRLSPYFQQIITNLKH